MELDYELRKKIVDKTVILYLNNINSAYLDMKNNIKILGQINSELFEFYKYLNILSSKESSFIDKNILLQNITECKKNIIDKYKEYIIQNIYYKHTIKIYEKSLEDYYEAYKESYKKYINDR